MLGTQIFHNSSMLSCLEILIPWRSEKTQLKLYWARRGWSRYERGPGCALLICVVDFWAMCVWLWGPILSRLVHETSQSRGGKEHLSKLQMQNWFSEEHVYWGWEFRAFMGLSEPHTTWEPPVAVLELSVPPGRDGGGRLKSVHF